MAGKSFGAKRQMGERQRSELFVSRRNARIGFSFLEVDVAILVTALNVAMNNAATVSFAPAQGGIGVTLRVYRGDFADSEFAGSPEELTELLMILIEGLYEGTNDLTSEHRKLLAEKLRKV